MDRSMVSVAVKHRMAHVNWRVVLTAALILIRRRRRRKEQQCIRKKRRHWIRPLFTDRQTHGAYYSLVGMMRETDRESFFRYLRMSPNRFDHLLELVGPLISKRTVVREPIPAEERLAATLRFLASGDSQQSISWQFKLGKATVCQMLEEVCEAIWVALSDYVRPPKTERDWLQIADDFERLWNLPHCLGAIDGKHIAIQAPKNSGTLYYNYKGFFSLVLLAICDARYCFSFIDLGEYGSNNDSGVLAHSLVGQYFKEGKMEIPNPAPIDGTTGSVPYFLVGDEIFPLSEWLMRPYSRKALDSEDKKIFNYRLSRARRVIENTFGMMVARWRLFRRPIEAKPEKVEKFTLAAIALHNYLRQTDTATYTPAGFADSEDGTGEIKEGEWRKIVSDDGAIRDISKVHGSRSKRSATDVHEQLTEYVVSDVGQLPWQWDYVRRSGHRIGEE